MEKIDRDKIHGLLWDGSVFRLPCHFRFTSVRNAKFEAKHYLGLYDVKYTSPWQFLFWEIFHIPHLLISIDKIRQKMFNLKTFHRNSRMEVLENLIEIRIAFLSNRNVFVNDPGIDSFEFLMNTYGTRIFSHPQFDELAARNRMILESLVESGDVIKTERRYRAADKALITLSIFEEDNRRHVDRNLQNWTLIALTFFIALPSIIQVWKYLSG